MTARGGIAAALVWGVVGGVLGGMLPPHAAQAQTAAEVGRSSRLAQVARACQVETERFCPDLDTTATPRDQLICLRPYKSSASLGCRNALNAAAR